MYVSRQKQMLRVLGRDLVTTKEKEVADYNSGLRWTFSALEKSTKSETD